MANDKKSEDQEKGFVVKDKRFSAKKEGEGDASVKEEKRGKSLREKVALSRIFLFLKSILLVSFFL